MIRHHWHYARKAAQTEKEELLELKKASKGKPGAGDFVK
jgi:hypothetical protein